LDPFSYEIIGGNGKLEDNKLIKTVENYNWDVLYIYSEELSVGRYEFEHQIVRVNGDKSGLVFGFFKSGIKDPSLNCINTNVYGLSMAGNGYNYKCTYNY